MERVRLEKKENKTILHIGSIMCDLNESDHKDLVSIFSKIKLPSESKISQAANRAFFEAEKKFKVKFTLDQKNYFISGFNYGIFYVEQQQNKFKIK